MRRLLCLLLALLTLLSLTACGGTEEPDTAEDQAPIEVIPEPEPEPEPYTILDPTVMPEGGVRDGVTYAEYNG
ncbi:MAG: hydrolase, partial [Oscillibacter sp.]|nr:hydrolase [Oscillibacter sp.]